MPGTAASGQKKLPPTAEAAGSKPLFFYFPPPAPRGRPTKPKGRGGRGRGIGGRASDGPKKRIPHTVAYRKNAAGEKNPKETLNAGLSKLRDQAPLSAEEATAVLSAATSKGKQSRTNWSTPPNLERMVKAVRDWKQQDGEWVAEISRRGYAKKVNSPYGPLFDRIDGKVSMESHAGRPSILSADDEQFVVDTIRRRDRGCEGMTPPEIADLIDDLRPDIRPLQASQVAKNLRKRHQKEELTGTTKAQATTTARANINIGQQYRFHKVTAACMSRQAAAWPESIITQKTKMRRGVCFLVLYAQSWMVGRHETTLGSWGGDG